MRRFSGKLIVDIKTRVHTPNLLFPCYCVQTTLHKQSAEQKLFSSWYELKHQPELKKTKQNILESF